MITYSQVTCDACGTSEQISAEDQQRAHSTPPGWLHGTISVWDSENKEGPLFGHICPECCGLPLRDLVEQFASYRAGIGARLS